MGWISGDAERGKSTSATLCIPLTLTLSPGGRGDNRGPVIYFTRAQSPCFTSTMWKASSVRPMWSLALMVTVPPVPT